MADQPTFGAVYLVGAGPGDPGLITVRGRDLLQRAHVVVYDYLANPLLLNHCPSAEKIYVGKQASRHAMTQDQINQLLVEQGKLGKQVVRLKGGDPFVFGRGGEECQALAQAGIRFEVVPGITAAIAAPAYAGIPVTHRDINSSFTLVTGHEKEAEYQDSESRARQTSRSTASGEPTSDIDWSVLAKLPCVSFYMGVKSLPRISQKLIENGMPPETPAAAIQWGTTPKQRTVAGTIADLPKRVADAQLTPPALIIVGQVVRLRETINWFESRPLFGKTIVVTRTRQQASDLSTQLSELGARIIEAPTIELVEPPTWNQVDQALNSAATYDWIIFTSANAVEFTRRRLLEINGDARSFGAAKIAAIGDATARAISEHLCLKVDLCPKKFVAEALADEFAAKNQIKSKRFLLLRADIARPILNQRLSDGGAAKIDDIAIYQTKSVASLPPELIEALEEKKIDCITFTSSSTARNFIALLGEQRLSLLKGIQIASIGPITSEEVKKLGLTPTIEAQTSNIQGVVEAIKNASK